MHPLAHLYAILFFPFFPPSSSPTTSPPLVPTGTVNFTSDPKAIINGIYGNLFTILTLVAGIAAVIYLVWAGIQYISAGGNAEKVKKARASIITAVIGVIVVAAAFYILRFAVGVGNSAASL
jgi:amino acid transporter